MNSDKAREFFSSYYEGTIERGLKQAFERQMSTDAQVQAEYKAFERTMKELEGIAVDVPEPEFDLHDRIMARLDRHLLEQKKKPAAFLGFRFKHAVAIGAIGLVLVGAAISIRTFSPNWSSGILTQSSTIADQFTVSIDKGVPAVEFRTAERKKVIIRQVDTGKVLSEEVVNGVGLAKGAQGRFLLDYQSELATLLSVTISGTKEPTYVVLPGTTKTEQLTGSGSLTDLAVALANTYQVTVVITTAANSKVSWDFAKQTNPVSAATNALQDTQRTVDMRKQNIIWIQ